MKLNTKGHAGAFGISGSGKTFGAVRHFKECDGYAILINTMRKRRPDVEIDGPFVDGKNPKILEAITECLNKEGRVVVDTDDEPTVKKILDYFEGWYDDSYGLLWFFVDEVDEYSSFRTGFQSAVERLFTKLRNTGIRGYAIAQRTSGQCSKNIVGQIREFFFYQMFPDDLDDVGRHYGLPRKYDETLKATKYVQPPEYCCYHWLNNRVTLVDKNGVEHEIDTEGNPNDEAEETDEETEDDESEDVDDGVSAEDNEADDKELPKPEAVGEAKPDEHAK